MTVTVTGKSCSFYSSNSKWHDVLVPVGYTIDAYDIDDTHIGEAVVTIPGTFSMVVYGDDGGGIGPAAGETVLFRINSVQVDVVQGISSFQENASTNVTLLVWGSTLSSGATVKVTVKYREDAAFQRCPICNLLLARDVIVWRNHMEVIHSADATSWTTTTIVDDNGVSVVVPAVNVQEGQTGGRLDTSDVRYTFGYICYCCATKPGFVSRPALKAHLGSKHSCLV